MPSEGEKLRVLVVDDNLDAATSLCSLVRHAGCEVAAAFGMPVALAVAASFEPEVIILDLEMPDADGCEVLREMQGPGRDLRDGLYICLTGSDSDGNRRRCEAAGFDRFYSKPLRSRELAEILEEAVARRLQRRASS